MGETSYGHMLAKGSTVAAVTIGTWRSSLIGRSDRRGRRPQTRGSVAYSTPEMYCTVRSTWQE
ncbi:hypothetical protein GCM10025786_20700 [Nocardioides caeni]